MHLHYEQAGAGRPRAADPVVMLHGGGPGASGCPTSGGTCRCSRERFRTLVVDQPGFGKSDKPPVEGNYFTFAADALAGLLDELGIDRVHLVGNSLGGGTAVRFALRYPERAGRLVLMAPGGLSLTCSPPTPPRGSGAWRSSRRRPGRAGRRWRRSCARWSSTSGWSPTS